MLRAGLEPATCRLRVDNRDRSGPQQLVVGIRRGRGVQSDARRRTATAEGRSAHEITEPLRPATITRKANPPGFEPGPARLELAVLPLHHGLVRMKSTPGWSRTSGLCRGRAAICPLRYERSKRESPRQELNPHLGRTKGACLPLTLRRRRWRRQGSNLLLLGASEVLFPLSYVPRMQSADGWSRTTTALRQRRYRPRSSAMLSVRMWSDRPDSNRHRGDHDPGCLPLHHSHSIGGYVWRGRPDSNRRPLGRQPSALRA